MREIIDKQIKNRLITLNENKNLLSKILRGIERETLRVNNRGEISQLKHPTKLGKSLTHPYITTDYSEALLEFITPPFSNPQQLINFLIDLHKFTYLNMDDSELLWPLSMPPNVIDESSISIANYGTSNSGKMKMIYRQGLLNRYGSKMQIIAGNHYNFSIPDNLWEAFQTFDKKNDLTLTEYKSVQYMNLIRNFHRFSFIIPYLFGASPNYDTTTNAHNTSIRISDQGYYNSSNIPFNVSYNSISEYITDLNNIINRTDPKWEKLGIKDISGNYSQLHDGILQIANEYYSTVRPKQIARCCESPQMALTRGVEYVEIRILDINPFSEIGISEEQIYFLDLLLLFCAIADSPSIDNNEFIQIKSNLNIAIERGRDIESKINIFNHESSIKDFTLNLIDELVILANLMDNACGTNMYSYHLNNIKNKIVIPHNLYSLQLLDSIKNSQLNSTDLGVKLASKYRDKFTKYNLSPEKILHFQTIADNSILEQQKLEKSDKWSIQKYIENYLSSEYKGC